MSSGVEFCSCYPLCFSCDKLFLKSYCLIFLLLVLLLYCYFCFWGCHEQTCRMNLWQWCSDTVMQSRAFLSSERNVLVLPPTEHIFTKHQLYHFNQAVSVAWLILWYTFIIIRFKFATEALQNGLVFHTNLVYIIKQSSILL